jgi:hypothetical protein
MKDFNTCRNICTAKALQRNTVQFYGVTNQSSIMLEYFLRSEALNRIVRRAAAATSPTLVLGGLI